MLVCCHALKWERNDSNKRQRFVVLHEAKKEIVTIRAFFFREMWKFPGEKSTSVNFSCQRKLFFSYFSHFHLHHRRHSSAKSWEGGLRGGEKEKSWIPSQWELPTQRENGKLSRQAYSVEIRNCEIFHSHTILLPRVETSESCELWEWKMSVWEICWNDKFAGDDYVECRRTYSVEKAHKRIQPKGSMA